MRTVLAFFTIRLARRICRADSCLRLFLAQAALIVFPGLADAQSPFTPNDLLLNVFSTSVGSSRIERLQLDGTPLWTSTTGAGTGWVGCAVTPQGLLATTRRAPQTGVDLFDASGTQIAEFPTPEVSANGDISVFSDGTLAVMDWGAGAIGAVELYTQAGAWISQLLPPGATHPFGSYIDRNDHLYVGEVNSALTAGQIRKVDRAGNVLLTVPLAWVPGDLVVGPDGTLWVADRTYRLVRHFDSAGSQLGSFPVSVNGLFWGIARASDGTLFVTGDSSSTILKYSDTGTLLGSIPMQGSGSIPCFMLIPERFCVPMTYCSAKVNSIGCLPAIAGAGLASATAGIGFTVSAANVRNQKSGLLLYGASGRSATPFQGAYLCVQSPVRRTTGVNSGGTTLPASDCSGVYSIDMNAFSHGALGGNPLATLTVAGTLVDCQWWGRDPGFPAPDNSTLSDALEYLVCP